MSQPPRNQTMDEYLRGVNENTVETIRRDVSTINGDGLQTESGSIRPPVGVENGFYGPWTSFGRPRGFPVGHPAETTLENTYQAPYPSRSATPNPASSGAPPLMRRFATPAPSSTGHNYASGYGAPPPPPLYRYGSSGYYDAPSATVSTQFGIAGPMAPPPRPLGRGQRIDPPLRPASAAPTARHPGGAPSLRRDPPSDWHSWPYMNSQGGRGGPSTVLPQQMPSSQRIFTGFGTPLVQSARPQRPSSSARASASAAQQRSRSLPDTIDSAISSYAIKPEKEEQTFSFQERSDCFDEALQKAIEKLQFGSKDDTYRRSYRACIGRGWTRNKLIEHFRRQYPDVGGLRRVAVGVKTRLTPVYDARNTFTGWRTDFVMEDEVRGNTMWVPVDSRGRESEWEFSIRWDSVRPA